MHVAVAGGHSKGAPGASHYIDEYTEDRKVASALIDELKARGCAVTSCSNEIGNQSGELAEECRLANGSGADLFVAIHFNAASVTGGTRGTEVWHYSTSGAGKGYAASVSAKLASALGLPNRGAKATDSLYVLRHTTMPAILVEVCFVDAKGDVDAYRSLGYQKVAAAIADAICGTSEGAVADTPAPSQPAASQPSAGTVTVDGWWGVKTTLALQRHYQTGYYDGIVSNQDSAQKPYLERCDLGSWDFAGSGNGSNLISAMQADFGAKVDGFAGPSTVKAIQRRLGVTVDGYCGVNTVTALQNWINGGF